MDIFKWTRNHIYIYIYIHVWISVHGYPSTGVHTWIFVYVYSRTDIHVWRTAYSRPESARTATQDAPNSQAAQNNSSEPQKEPKTIPEAPVMLRRYLSVLGLLVECSSRAARRLERAARRLGSGGTAARAEGTAARVGRHGGSGRAARRLGRATRRLGSGGTAAGAGLLGGTTRVFKHTMKGASCPRMLWNLIWSIVTHSYSPHTCK